MLKYARGHSCAGRCWPCSHRRLRLVVAHARVLASAAGFRAALRPTTTCLPEGRTLSYRFSDGRTPDAIGKQRNKNRKPQKSRRRLSTIMALLRTRYARTSHIFSGDDSRGDASRHSRRVTTPCSTVSHRVAKRFTLATQTATPNRNFVRSRRMRNEFGFQLHVFTPRCNVVRLRGSCARTPCTRALSFRPYTQCVKTETVTLYCSFPF